MNEGCGKENHKYKGEEIQTNKHTHKKNILNLAR